MSNPYFQFKQFTIYQDRCAMKVTTDASLFGAWVAGQLGSWAVGQSGSLQSGNQQSGSWAVGSRTIGNIMDIGTGTGLLSLMVAQKNPLVRIDAIEIDAEAAAQAKENFDDSTWDERVTIMNIDARTFIPEAKYDCIISNPPFYENELRSPDSKKNIARHEGLELKELLGIIKNNLFPDGRFYLLLPYKRNPDIKDLLGKHELAILQMVFVRQSITHDYFRIMLMGKLKNNEPVETMIDEISIRDDQEQYTKEFIGLLKDYYLHL